MTQPIRLGGRTLRDLDEIGALIEVKLAEREVA